jgi:hypothetical protein
MIWYNPGVKRTLNNQGIVMNSSKLPESESDPRFPSGKWLGFFLQKEVPGRHWMELFLTFANGIMTGTGRDWVGEFVIEGTYDIDNGAAHWNKSYIGKHVVTYKGFNEGKGIWGTWELITQSQTITGGFHIWPEGMPDPTQPRVAEEAEVPNEIIRESLLPAEQLQPT